MIDVSASASRRQIILIERIYTRKFATTISSK